MSSAQDFVTVAVIKYLTILEPNYTHFLDKTWAQSKISWELLFYNLYVIYTVIKYLTILEPNYTHFLDKTWAQSKSSWQLLLLRYLTLRYLVFWSQLNLECDEVHPPKLTVKAWKPTSTAKKIKSSKKLTTKDGTKKSWGQLSKNYKINQVLFSFKNGHSLGVLALAWLRQVWVNIGTSSERNLFVNSVFNFIININCWAMNSSNRYETSYSGGSTQNFDRVLSKKKTVKMRFCPFSFKFGYFDQVPETLWPHLNPLLSYDHFKTYCEMCSSLSVRFSFVLVLSKQRKTKMAEMIVGEVVLRCEVSLGYSQGDWNSEELKQTSILKYSKIFTVTYEAQAYRS